MSGENVLQKEYIELLTMKSFFLKQVFQKDSQIINLTKLKVGNEQNHELKIPKLKA